MTKPLETRKTITKNKIAEHNYNYVNPTQTTHPLRINRQNHLFSQKLNFPITSTNSVNFHDYPHPSQDQSENYPFSQQNRNKHHIIHQTIYHQMMTIITNQVFLHHTHKNIVQKNLDKIKHPKT